MKKVDPEEQDAEITRSIQHLLHAPQPENVRSWIAWYRYFREGGATVIDSFLYGWRTAQPVRRRLSDAWWLLKIPFLSAYEVMRDTWREYRNKKNRT